MTPQFDYPLDSPPMLFSLSRWMIRHQIRGGWRLWKILHDRGLVNCVTQYHLDGPFGQTPIFVPLHRPESSWSAIEIRDYDRGVVDIVSSRVVRFDAPLQVIDCGADIGMVAASLIRGCCGIVKVLAFEPNEKSYIYLNASAPNWSVPVQVVNSAVGRKNMRGALISPPTDDSDHARYIVEDPNGPIEVRSIDSYDIDHTHAIILKVDVEGAELDVLDGASDILERAPDFVVIFEAHPDVFERNGIDPCVIIRKLNEISPVDVVIAEMPDFNFDMNKPFFEQFGSQVSIVRNVICATSPG